MHGRIGPGTAALVELYTSEGCSSCPPADRWLSSLSARPPGTVVPLALHVDYWDYIGWKDPYAKREFSLRQRKLTQLQRMALVYTPQVVLQGRDFRAWGSPAFDEARGADQRPAGQGEPQARAPGRGPGRRWRSKPRPSLAGPAEDAALYLAAYQQQARKPGDGGREPRPHAHPRLRGAGVAGPVGLRRDPPDASAAGCRFCRAPTRRNSGVAAFVQDRRTGEVLQALLRSSC